MNSFLLKKIACFTLLIVSMSSFAQTNVLSKNARVSVITCDTGTESYSLFGHTAIRITDLENTLDVVYNYGAFDFSTPNFTAKFIKGNLQYFAIAHSFSDFMYQYTSEQRSVYEQELIIPLTYKQKLFDNLNAILASEESHYTYKFIDKNCTSMVVDVLNKTLEAKIIVKKTDTDKTYRSILFSYFDNLFYEKLGTSIIFGKKVDGYGTKIFLPLELHKSLKQIRFENHLLCKESKTLLEFKKELPKSWWNSIYTFVLFLALILIVNNNKADLFYLFIMGVFGILLSFLEFYSLHQELTYNYNLLLFNPTLLLLLYFIFQKNKKWIINLSVFNFLLTTIYLIIMINKIHFLIVLPLMITSTILLVKIAIINRK